MAKRIAQSDKILAIPGWDGITGNTYLTDPYLNMQQCVDSIITYDPIIYTPGITAETPEFLCRWLQGLPKLQQVRIGIRLD